MEDTFVCSGCHKNYHRLESLNKRNFIFSQFWRLDVPDQGPGGSSSVESSLLALQMAILLCSHMVERASSLVSLRIGTLILADQCPKLLTSFNPDYFHKGPISKRSHIVEWEFPHTRFEGINSLVHNTVLSRLVTWSDYYRSHCRAVLRIDLGVGENGSRKEM